MKRKKNKEEKIKKSDNLDIDKKDKSKDFELKDNKKPNDIEAIDSELEEIIEGDEEVEIPQFETNLSIGNVKAPVLEKVAQLNESVRVSSFFNPREEIEDERNVEYTSKKVDYITDAQGITQQNQVQYQESQINYDVMSRQNSESRQTRRIMQNVGERISNQPSRQNEWTMERDIDINTDQIEDSRKYINKGDKK